jgi:hypothetical protein
VKPEPQRDAAPAPTALTPNLILMAIGGLSKMSQTVIVLTFPEPPEPHQRFFPELEPHQSDGAPQQFSTIV